MKCLSVSAQRVGRDLKVCVNGIGQLVLACACLTAGAGISVQRVADDIHVGAELISTELAVSASSPKLVVRAERIGEELKASAENIPCNLHVSAFGSDNRLVVGASRISKDLSVRSDRYGDRLRVNCSIVCSIGISKSMWMWDAGEKLLWDNSEVISI